jgi:protein-S-isoprenylcysteine O-methyltransferase Ste14
MTSALGSSWIPYPTDTLPQCLSIGLCFVVFVLFHSGACTQAVKAWVDRQAPVLSRPYRLAFNLSSLAFLVPLLTWAYGPSAIPCPGVTSAESLIHSVARALVDWTPGSTLIGGFPQKPCELRSSDRIYDFSAKEDDFSSLLRGVLIVLRLFAAIVFVYVTRTAYDMGEFSGLAQVRDGLSKEKKGEKFKVSAVEKNQPMSISPTHRFVRHPWYTCIITLMWTSSWLDWPTFTFNVCATLYFCLGALWFEEPRLVTLFGKRYEEYRRRVPLVVPMPFLWSLTEREARELLAGKLQ